MLEGGGMRGIYTAGVLDVFMEQGVCFDGVLGVSAGAIHGSSYVSGQKGRSIRYYRKYIGNWRFMSLRSLFLTGELVGRKLCYEDIPNRLDPFDYEAFKASDTAFYVGCSNLKTGKGEYLRVTDLRRQMDLLRASASLPYVSKPVDYRGMKLLDGGCTDSIPVAVMRRLGYKRLVVVQTRQRGYVKEPEFRTIAKILYWKYPRFVRALARRHIAYNRELALIERLEQEGKIFVIRPEEALPIGRTKAAVKDVDAVYALGLRDGTARLEDMLAWLGR